uniref:3'-5' exonuclease n=1 Tax=Caldisericum exile TaxID=693075 RepID=A0A7C4TWC8_9BACT
MKIVFFDLETTGLNKDDEVIEIGALKVIDWEVVSHFKTLVRPHKTISRFVTNLTGITQEDLEKAQDKEKIKKEFKAFIEDAILVAHNAQFDKEFLERFFEEPLHNVIVDTLELSRLAFPEFSSHSLEKLVSTLNLKKEKAHRAFNDASMLYDLFKKIREEINQFKGAHLKLIKELIGEVRDYNFFFTDALKEDAQELNLHYNTELTLLFQEERKKIIPQVLYLEGYGLDEVLNTLPHSERHLIVVYSDFLKSILKEHLSHFKVFDATYIENFACIKRLNYFLEHPKEVPEELRFDFAILTSYLIKTNDFLFENAPHHILKSNALKNLSICEGNGCNFENDCPLTKRRVELLKSDILIMKQTSFYNSLGLLSQMNFDRIIFLEAFRLPKVFYSMRFNFSKSDIEMSEHFEEKKTSHLLTLFDNEFKKDAFDTWKKEIIEKMPGFSHYYVDKEVSFNYENKSIVVSFSNPKNLFSKIDNAKNIVFASDFIEYNGENQISSFVGLDGIFLRKEKDFHVLNLVPLYTHAPNADEFLKEFLDTYDAFSQVTPALFVFENRTQLNLFKTELRKIYPHIDSAVENEERSYEFSSYDKPVDGYYKLIFIVKLPLNMLSYSDKYPLYYLKNFVGGFIKEREKSVVFYFDGRLKDRNFLTNVQDAFLTTPLPMERKDALIQFVKKYLSI